MNIKGIEHMSSDSIEIELRQGGKFVAFDYCVSIGILTFRRSSEVYFVRYNESAVIKGLKFSLISAIFGWWGIPWGPFYTIQSFITNFKGGRNVTKQYFF